MRRGACGGKAVSQEHAPAPGRFPCVRLVEGSMYWVGGTGLIILIVLLIVLLT